jgi:phytoene/squalene synthetase
MDLYLKNALQISKDTTKNYSTSFSLGVGLLGKEIRDAIYGIYGYVRFADEIVDTFYDQDQQALLEDFRQETYRAIESGLSTNPIIHSFQWVVNTYKLDHNLIDAFLTSMAMDLSKKQYDEEAYKTYIYGSAEVVGLMCLKVFCKGNNEQYCSLIQPARKLGEAFQKVNFLRDMESDYELRGRTYFPRVDFSAFTTENKRLIEKDIDNDFHIALQGIVELPRNARFGVYLAYKYYLALLRKIHRTPAEKILYARIRIPNYRKILILIESVAIYGFTAGRVFSIRKTWVWDNFLRYAYLYNRP